MKIISPEIKIRKKKICNGSFVEEKLFIRYNDSYSIYVSQEIDLTLIILRRNTKCVQIVFDMG